jgi:hypothetical protein
MISTNTALIHHTYLWTGDCVESGEHTQKVLANEMLIAMSHLGSLLACFAIGANIPIIGESDPF